LPASREERLYDREAVLGRDASSVFPTESKKLGKLDKDAAAAVIGSMQFVTESQARSTSLMTTQSHLILAPHPQVTAIEP
jgi:hypothetical protein